MAKTRELVCIHYIHHENCDLGKKADFYGLCQTCPQYKFKPGSKPARTDNRKQKMERIMRKERGRYDD